MNKESSRSHSIFTIFIESKVDKDDGKERYVAGKLNLVDLAGSERQSKTQAVGDRLKEANKINLSLSALGNVISALVDGKSSYIPYRDSKLTRLLQDSLGGNTKTVMVAAISTADYNYDETLSTLRYASRAKNIKNRPIINEDPKDALLRQYENELKKLRELVENMGKNGNTQQIRDTEDEIEKSMTNSKIFSMEQHKDEMVKLEKDKNELSDQLKNREQIIQSEKGQKEHLKNLIQEMEEKMVTGGKQLEEKEKESAMQHRQMQIKLQKQKKKEIQLIEDALKKEEEMMLIEKSYQNIQEELKDEKKIISELKEKCNAADCEIKDLQSEHQGQKEELLDTLRNNESEMQFFRKLLHSMLPESQIDLLRNKCEWDDENKTWSIPPFKIQDMQIYLPSIPKLQVSEYIENERNKREVIFSNQSTLNLNSRHGNKMPIHTKTGMPTMQIKKRKVEEAGKYFNMDAHKIKQSPLQNGDKYVKIAAQIQNDEPKMPGRRAKLTKIDDTLLSNIAKQLPPIQ